MATTNAREAFDRPSRKHPDTYIRPPAPANSRLHPDADAGQRRAFPDYHHIDPRKVQALNGGYKKACEENIPPGQAWENPLRPSKRPLPVEYHPEATPVVNKRLQTMAKNPNPPEIISLVDDDGTPPPYKSPYGPPPGAHYPGHHSIPGAGHYPVNAYHYPVSAASHAGQGGQSSHATALAAHHGPLYPAAAYYAPYPTSIQDVSPGRQTYYPPNVIPNHAISMTPPVYQYSGNPPPHMQGQHKEASPASASQASSLPASTPENQPKKSTKKRATPREAASSKLENFTEDIIPISEPVLCEEQARLVDLILSRRNVFYTGSAGCGKSTVLKAFVKKCEEQNLRVNIIAPTGRAALDVNGSTTWTYAGWTPDSHKKPLENLKKAAHGKFVQKRLSETDILVIDEVSMVENLHFERLNAVMKEARNDTRPFGGVQLVVTGDFCQLPPVKPFRHCITCGRELKPNRESTEYKCSQHGVYYDIDKWAFRSKAWEECDFVHVNLTQIHRQSDSVFIGILQKLRMGHALLSEDIDLLLNHDSQTHNSVKLFATREEVKRVNDEQFNKLRSKARPYKSMDHFRWNEKHRNLESKSLRAVDGSLIALRDHRFDSQIQLKQGMLVVLLTNLDIASGLVNGSQGVITGWEKYDPKKLPKAVKQSRQGKDQEMDAMLSGGLTGDYAQHREDRIKEFIHQAERKEWPVVRFVNGVTRTIYADCTVNEIGDDQPYSLLSRAQIPLMAAWAMTTHKSQGMTLNRVVVDLAKSFEQGQAYVALSRARSLEGLKVISFPKSAQGTGNVQVKQFLREKFGIE